ncbi:MAG TPA: 16S rRNA (cytosine(1402)-N(4))-methyltransferase [Candidatus Moranbacteria bacterium]|nr:16S rRNA (cytosine(1402)-N(4))-methyltransferase [Candidatus Moranbacteria bacterium]
MTIHKPVLLHESIEGLNLKSGDVVVDATLGGGGHSKRILEEIGEEGALIVMDVDFQAIKDFKFQISSAAADQFPIKSHPEYSGQISNKIESLGNIFLANSNFTGLENILKEIGIEKVDAILADLGYSSIQLEDESYGMSFLKDSELDMRLNKDQDLSAKKIVNEYSHKDLERILKEYGEEKFSGNITNKIIEQRKEKKIEKTSELVELINQAIPEKFKHGKLHPATKTFQALRIEVNRELDNLEKFVPAAIKSLKPGGRLAIISFHSLEDRIVKNIFRVQARGCLCPPDFPKCVCGHEAEVKIVTRKPIVPGEEESLENPRSRSAKLRVCEKL